MADFNLDHQEMSMLWGRMMKLDLSKHCVETEIRRLYNRFISRYIRLKREDRQLETDIEMLKAALENLDFPKLRSGCRELAGHKGNSAIELAVKGDGRVAIIIDGAEIE